MKSNGASGTAASLLNVGSESINGLEVILMGGGWAQKQKEW